MIQVTSTLLHPIQWRVDHVVQNASEASTMASLSALRNCLELRRGAAHTVRYTFTDSATGRPYDLTGTLVTLAVGQAVVGVVLTRRSDQAGEMLVTAPRTGVVDVLFPSAVTRLLLIQEYDYEVWITAGASRELVVRATLRILPTVLPL